MNPADLEINKDYSIIVIDNCFEDMGFQEHEFGKKYVGEHFLSYIHAEKDVTVSFVLTGGTVHGYIYKCVYNDFKDPRS